MHGLCLLQSDGPAIVKGFNSACKSDLAINVISRTATIKSDLWTARMKNERKSDVAAPGKDQL